MEKIYIKVQEQNLLLKKERKKERKKESQYVI